MREASAGKDTITGHWEMAGLVTTQAMATFPNGFPPRDHDAAARRRPGAACSATSRVGHGDHRRARRAAHGDRRSDPLHVGRFGPADRRARGGRAAPRAVPDLRGGARDRRPPPHRARDRASVRRRARRLPAHLQPPRLLAGAARADAARPHRATPASRWSASARSPTSSPAAALELLDPQRGQRRRPAPDAGGAGDAGPRPAVRQPGRLRHALRPPQRHRRASRARCASSTPGCRRCEARAAPRATSRSSPPTTATIRRRRAPTTRASRCRCSRSARRPPRAASARARRSATSGRRSPTGWASRRSPHGESFLAALRAPGMKRPPPLAVPSLIAAKRDGGALDRRRDRAPSSPAPRAATSPTTSCRRC